jgi:hypothetical protein
VIAKLKKMNWWRYFPLLAVGAIMLGMSAKTPMWMDEYCFYRLSSELPKYNSTSDWFFVDRPSMLALSIKWVGIDQRASFNLDYDTPIYTHTPLAPILVAPIVKGLNYLADKGVIQHIEAQPGMVVDEKNGAETITWILRIIPILLFVWTMWLIFKLMEHKVGKHAYMMWIPMLVGMRMFQGAFYFYWDVFMWFFFVLTLYIQEMHPNSKWKYVTACCLVNTKMFVGIAFLAPLVIKEIKNNWVSGVWKRNNWASSFAMALTALSILPFYIATIVVTHNPLYVWQHYAAQIPVHNYIYTLNNLPNYINILFSLGTPVFLAIAVLLLSKFKKYPAYAIFTIIGLLYAWGAGLGMTQTTAMLYVGVITMPLVSYEFNLIERSKKWLHIGELVKEDR